jgi:hypothetical protein
MNAGWIALAGLTLATCRPTGPNGMAEARADELSAVSAPRSVAVVELFTSEGCSSCPPADWLLADLAKTRPVFVLGFHVDYWDDLGWPDRFASADCTARQRTYAHSFGGQGLYTPQMIVNGVEAFNGSDRDRAEQAIARALAHPAPVPLSIAVRKAASDVIAIDYDAPNAPADAVIDIAVVEHSTSSDVHAGENAGRVLHHTNVVRVFVSVPLAKRVGSTAIRVPASLPRQDGEVIAYVQRSSSQSGMPILGAAHAMLPR